MVAALVAVTFAQLAWDSLFAMVTENMFENRAPFWMHSSVSPRTLVYAALLTLVAAAIAGLLPGLKVLALPAEKPVRDNVAMFFKAGVSQLTVAGNGTAAYIPADSVDVNTEIVWLDRAGRTAPAVPLRRRFLAVRLSPDNRRVALTIDDTHADVWTYDFDRGVLGRVTSGGASEFNPRWLPDGRALLYASERLVFHIKRKAPVGSAPEEALVTNRYDTAPSAPSLATRDRFPNGARQSRCGAFLTLAYRPAQKSRRSEENTDTSRGRHPCSADSPASLVCWL